MDLYTEIMIDHYKRPRNKGKLKKKTVAMKDYNPSCGDEIEMQFLIEKGKIKDVRFNGQGCLISQATASILTEKIKGMNVEDVFMYKKEKFVNDLGIVVSPTRIKCALLPLKVAKLAAAKYLGKKVNNKIN